MSASARRARSGRQATRRREPAPGDGDASKEAAALGLLQATLIAVAGALRQQACDYDEELAAVLEQHGIRVLDALLSTTPAVSPVPAVRR